MPSHGKTCKHCLKEKRHQPLSDASYIVVCLRSLRANLAIRIDADDTSPFGQPVWSQTHAPR